MVISNDSYLIVIICLHTTILYKRAANKQTTITAKTSNKRKQNKKTKTKNKKQKGNQKAKNKFKKLLCEQQSLHQMMN